MTDSWTVSTIDYDNDGDDDLFFTDRTGSQSNKLFRNNGHCVFTAVTTGNLVTDMAKSIASSWADFDNDGDLDVVVANNTLKANFFYVNNGNGTFTKNTTAGFVQNVGYYHHVSWIDVDNDGQLELYFGNYWPTKFNELWRRNAQGNWELWQDNLLSQITGSGVGSTWCDYDNDGYQDLVILNNAGGNNRMYRNLGNGQFVAVSNVITADGGNSVASTWGDIDNDGDMDLYISNASNTNNDLYINNGNGQFTAVTTDPVVTMGGHSHGAVFSDVDQDGDLDLYVSNDQGVKFLYMNDGNGGFTPKTDEWPTANFGKGYGVAMSDLDLDGDVDMVNATHSNQRNYIFRANDNYNNNTWLTVRLTGTNSNVSAVGARIYAYSGSEIMVRGVNSQNGLGGQNSYRQSFGCGSATALDSLVIDWPSGLRQVITLVNTNQHLSIIEPNGAMVIAKVYYDQNGNCTKDSGENYISNTKMAFNSGDHVAYSNTDGEVSAYLGIGNHQLNLDDDRYTATCAMPYNFQVATLGVTQNIGDFGVQPVCGDADLALTAMTTVMRRGFSSKYIVQVTNNGMASSTGNTVTIQLPTAIQVDSMSVDYTTLSTNGTTQTLEVELQDLDLNETTLFELYYTVTLTLMPGDPITASFVADGSQSDCNASDNSVADFQEIFGSFDPNDIAVYPIGYTEEHYISPKQDLTYRIRFQNVGNYPAEFVTIIDTLPNGINPASIKGIVASHNYSLTISGRVLTFRFDNIQLPDSASNPEGSNGFVQFTVKQKAQNTAGMVLRNAADIRFDYNESIITNRVFNTIMSDDSGVDNGVLVVFPNPVYDASYVRAKTVGLESPILKSLEVYNGNGLLVHQENVDSAMHRINLSRLSAGRYTLVAKDFLGNRYSAPIVVMSGK
jgi:uncharacterized repeat protein (TIGR01451 family)